MKFLFADPTMKLCGDQHFEATIYKRWLSSDLIQMICILLSIAQFQGKGKQKEVWNQAASWLFWMLWRVLISEAGANMTDISIWGKYMTWKNNEQGEVSIDVIATKNNKSPYSKICIKTLRVFANRAPDFSYLAIQHVENFEPSNIEKITLNILIDTLSSIATFVIDFKSILITFPVSVVDSTL